MALGSLTLSGLADGVESWGGPMRAALSALDSDVIEVTFANGAWPARPTVAGHQYVVWRSTRPVAGSSDTFATVQAAPPPPNAIDGDEWAAHPMSPYRAA